MYEIENWNVLNPISSFSAHFVFNFSKITNWEVLLALQVVDKRNDCRSKKHFLLRTQVWFFSIKLKCLLDCSSSVIIYNEIFESEINCKIWKNVGSALATIDWVGNLRTKSPFENVCKNL